MVLALGNSIYEVMFMVGFFKRLNFSGTWFWAVFR
jgi:hypothetical protein